MWLLALSTLQSIFAFPPLLKYAWQLFKKSNLFQTRLSDPSLAGDTCNRVTNVSRASGFCHQRSFLPDFISVLLFPPLSALLPDSVTQQSAMQQTGKPVPTSSCQFNVSSSAESASLDTQIGVKVHVDHKVNLVDIMADFIYHLQFVVEQFPDLPADYWGLGQCVSRTRCTLILFSRSFHGSPVCSQTCCEVQISSHLFHRGFSQRAA